MAHYIGDLRFGLRQLRLNPTFTAVAVLSLALGIGANTAIFQLIDAIRLRTLPVGSPAGAGVYRFPERLPSIGLVVHAQRKLHVRTMGERAHAPAGVFRSDGMERERVQSHSGREGAVRGRSVRQRRFLQSPADTRCYRPNDHVAGRSARLRVTRRSDQLRILAG